jgi:hypothetical protein
MEIFKLKKIKSFNVEIKLLLLFEMERKHWGKKLKIKNKTNQSTNHKRGKLKNGKIGEFLELTIKKMISIIIITSSRCNIT